MKVIQTNTASFSENSHKVKVIKFYLIDKVLAFTVLSLLSPVIVYNCLISIITKRSIYTSTFKADALGQHVFVRTFRSGVLQKTASFIDVLQGRLNFCGIPLTHILAPKAHLTIKAQFKCAPGLISLYDLHKRTGLAVSDPAALLEKQLNFNAVQYLGLIFKSFFCFCLYGDDKNLEYKKAITVFGLSLNNSSMANAVSWVTSDKKLTLDNSPKLGFFINVNSINITFNNPGFKKTLAKADMILADGSGMRLAAKSAGLLLKDNTNGTDMLPHICKSCVKQSKSLYFLGSEEGVAEKAAEQLTKSYPGLNVVGTHHGFLTPDQTEIQINKINESGCDILLVAMGSPFQEQWLVDNQEKLNCQTALAVGGLFDFYSGNITRSPLFIRELGLEWVWRLSQEPVKKFNRYILGNPLFLYRIYVLGLANKGNI